MLSPKLQQKYQNLRKRFAADNPQSAYSSKTFSDSKVFASWLLPELYKVEYPLGEKSAQILAHALRNWHIDPIEIANNSTFKDLHREHPHILEKPIVDRVLGDIDRGGDALYGLALSPEGHTRVLAQLWKEHQEGNPNSQEALRLYSRNYEAPFTADDLYRLSEKKQPLKTGSKDGIANWVARYLDPVQKMQFIKRCLEDAKNKLPNINRLLLVLNTNIAPETKAKALEHIVDEPDLIDHLANGKSSEWNQVFQELPDHVLQKISKLEVPEHYDNMKYYDAKRIKRLAFDLSDPLAKAAKFWLGYEGDVEPEHFAVGRSLHTNQPETLTDHRGDTGTSEPYMDLLPHLREYAKKTQEAVIEDIKRGSIMGFERNGKWFVKVFRGVGGNHAQDIIKKAAHPTLQGPGGVYNFKEGVVRIPAAHISSWTVDEEIARRFARRKISGHQKKIGVIMEKHMPVSHLLHSGFIDLFEDQGHAHEEESELVFHHPGDKPIHTIPTKGLTVIDATGGGSLPKNVAKSSYEDIFKKKQVQEVLMIKSEAPPLPPPAPKEYSDWE